MSIPNKLANFFSEYVKRPLKYRTREILSYGFHALKSHATDATRVVIFGQGRTGSTLLENLLCSTGHFRERGELLNVSPGEILFPTAFIRGLSLWRGNPNFIFHVKIYQLTEDRKRPVDPSTFMTTLQQEGWKIIYLKRKNKVKQALSNIMAEQRGGFFKFDKREEELVINIDCERFVSLVQNRFRHEEAEKEVLEKLDYHTVVYEDDLENTESHQEATHRIFEYVGLEPKQVASRYKKINTRLPKDFIENYDELMACLAQHGWQSFLE